MKPENHDTKRPIRTLTTIPRKRTIAQGNYNPVDSSNPTFGPQGTMTYGELAAFIAMLFWMDNGQPTATPFDSFYPTGSGRDQVTAIQNALKQGGLANNNAMFNQWQTLMADALVKQTLDALHKDFQQLVIAMGANWDGCATVGLDMLEKIANL